MSDGIESVIEEDVHRPVTGGIENRNGNSVIRTENITSRSSPEVVLNVSPRFSRLRKKASESLTRQGQRMQRLAQKRERASSELKRGIVVKINIPEEGRDKRNQGSLIAIIVEKTARGKYRLVCKGGVLARCFDRTQVSLIPVGNC